MSGRARVARDRILKCSLHPESRMRAEVGLVHLVRPVEPPIDLPDEAATTPGSPDSDGKRTFLGSKHRARSLGQSVLGNLSETN